MTTPLGWLTRSLADVPAGDRWLGPRERRVLAGLRVDKRRRDWQLGRCAAKAAVAAWLAVPAERIEILATSDGAPAAYIDGEAARVAISLSHRAERALAVVADAGCEVGCDLEVVEPRSRAFVGEWLAAAEQAIVATAVGGERHRLANLMWTAKEAAAKVRREGLRLDVRHAVTELPDARGSTPSWRPLSVSWPNGPTIAGWWRDEPGWVMAVASEPPPASPRELRDPVEIQS
jgi:4'-phosphopantetheinyl transferase